ncbi:MAG TPA: hypothetical protein VIN10_13505 [Bacteroidales bacterium]
MKTNTQGNPIVSWVLRILLIITILFFSMFSFDVFEENLGFWDTALAFLMHNIPTFVMITILIIAWNWESIGGILLMLGILGFATFIGLSSGRFMSGTLIVLGIPFLIGALFVVNHYFLGKKQAA